MYFIHEQKNKGYAILFTIVIVGIISIISLGLSSSAYKQLILSSVANDSTTAFYQADIASECALYYDSLHRNEIDKWISDYSSFGCAEKSLAVTNPSGDNLNFKINEDSNTSTDKKFDIEIVKSNDHTTIKANGYNMSDNSNLRMVQRTIQVDY